MNGSLDDFTGGLPPPASHVMVALLQSLQHEFSCLVQEQRNSNFSLARMELRMASLEDEIRKLSNRVDLIIENRNIVELRSSTNHIEPIQEPIQEASMSVSIINDTFSIEDSSSTVCLLDVTSCNDNIEHKEIINLIPPSQPIINNPPKPIKTTTAEKKRSRKDHTPIRNTMVVPTPLSFQEPEPACSIIPATLLLNVNNPIPQTLVEPKRNKRAEKNKKRQRSSEEEIPDEEIENLKNIIMREAAERAARQQLESNIDNLAEPERILINEIIKKSSSIDGVSEPKNSKRSSSEKSVSPNRRFPTTPISFPSLSFNNAPIKVEVEDAIPRNEK